jgi:ribosomal protein S1
VLKIGDRVKAQIIDLNKSKIYLSMKRLVDDPWKHVKEKYTVGQIVTGEVHKVEPFGLMVKLDPEIHGLAHISELSDSVVNDVNQLREMYKVGESYPFEIVSIEPAEHRLGLKREGVKGKSRKKAKDEETEKTDAPAAEATEAK